MNIIVTGSLGHISRPLTVKLVNGGHSVTVISRNQSKQREIESLGAKAAIGTMEDTEFLTREFTGADAVYCMEAPGNFLNPDYDLHEAHRRIGNNYFQVIGRSGVRRVVHLSSIGAHTDKGNGILSYHHEIESILNQLPADVSITFMRPVGFYYNLLAFINVIKKLGVIVSNYGEDDIIPWVSPKDVADAVADELTKPGSGRKIRYVASEELSCNQVAGILGKAIGKPDLKWEIISDQQMIDSLVSVGITPVIARGIAEMNAAQHSGILFEDYYSNRPELGKVKMTDFAHEFAAAYNQQ